MPASSSKHQSTPAIYLFPTPFCNSKCMEFGVTQGMAACSSSVSFTKMSESVQLEKLTALGREDSRPSAHRLHPCMEFSVTQVMAACSSIASFAKMIEDVQL